MARPTTKLSMLSKRRRAGPGTLEDLMLELWHAVRVASGLVDSSEPEMRLRAIHALSQVAGQYRSLLETVDLQDRIEALEGRIGGRLSKIV